MIAKTAANEDHVDCINTYGGWSSTNGNIYKGWGFCRRTDDEKNKRITKFQAYPNHFDPEKLKARSSSLMISLVLILCGVPSVHCWLPQRLFSSGGLTTTTISLDRGFERKRVWDGFVVASHQDGAPREETTPATIIEFQSEERYDRGDMHLTAAVHEGETVVYRTGSWYVDGVLVGDDDLPPAYELCRVETIQVVWTHNCEHGVLRGLAVDLLAPSEQDQRRELAYLALRTPLEDVEFGPEQIIARIRNVVWEPKTDGEQDEEVGTCSIALDPSLWKEHDANA